MRYDVWRYRLLIAGGVLLIITGAVLMGSAGHTSAHFHDDPSANDLQSGSGVLLIAIGAVALLSGWWYWSRDAPENR